jgi:lysozyme
MLNLLELFTRLKVHEGFRAKPYTDTEGVLTIGYGTNIDGGISQDEAEYLLANRLQEAAAAARALVTNFDKLSGERQSVLVEMAYQLGAVRMAGFKKMLAAVEADDPRTVAVEMLDDVLREMLNSKWARQVPNRAHELAERYRQG